MGKGVSPPCVRACGQAGVRGGGAGGRAGEGGGRSPVSKSNAMRLAGVIVTARSRDWKGKHCAGKRKPVQSMLIASASLSVQDVYSMGSRAE